MERYYQPEIETAPREEMIRLQTERLIKQVKHVWDDVPYYRKKMEDKGVTPDDIKTLDDLKKLPFLSKADLREAYPYGLMGAPLKDCVRIQSTSGTTGKRVVAFYKNGTVKKTQLEDYKNIRKSGLIAINLREGDELIEVKLTDNTNDIFLITKKGMCIRFPEIEARTVGRASIGVRGISLTKGDEVVAMQMDSQGQAILFATEYGMGKSTAVEDFSTQHRGGKGVKCYKITDKTGDIVGAKCVSNDKEIMLITNEGVVIRMNVADVRVLGRITSGVKLMDIDRKSDVKIASIAKVREEIVDDSLPSEGGAPADYNPGDIPTVAESVDKGIDKLLDAAEKDKESEE